MFRDRNLLHRKYIEERLSTTQIAREIFSSRPTVLRWLRIHGIEVRPTGSAIRRRTLAYGIQLRKRRETVVRKEAENIQKMVDLRNQGFSYWKIADILNSMKIPTKSGGGRWHSRVVQRIIENSDRILTMNVESTNSMEQ